MKPQHSSSALSQSLTLTMRAARYIVPMLVLCAGFSPVAWGDTVEKRLLFDPTLAEALNTSLHERLASNGMTGAILVVRDPQGATWRGTAGLATMETQQPMQLDNHFRIGSITKTFTATLILRLVDQGMISLETTVDEVVPELKIVMGDEITIRDLLEMRSGLNTYMSNPEFLNYLANDPGKIWTPEQLVELSNSKVSDPGTAFLYNNGGYVLLGLIIEKVTQKSYEEAVQVYIFDPVGMTHTSIPQNLNMPEPFASGYQYHVGLNMQPVEMNINATYYINPMSAWSSGAAISTQEDLLKWSRAFFSGSLLSPSIHSQQFAQLPVTYLENTAIDAYGLGTMQDGVLMGHDGYIPPYGSWLATYKGYDFILLCNSTGTATSSELSPLAATLLLQEILFDVFYDLRTPPTPPCEPGVNP